jgi:hypothetical protein
MSCSSSAVSRAPAPTVGRCRASAQTGVVGTSELGGGVFGTTGSSPPAACGGALGGAGGRGVSARLGGGAAGFSSAAGGVRMVFNSWISSTRPRAEGGGVDGVGETRSSIGGGLGRSLLIFVSVTGRSGGFSGAAAAFFCANTIGTIAIHSGHITTGCPAATSSSHWCLHLLHVNCTAIALSPYYLWSQQIANADVKNCRKFVM